MDYRVIELRSVVLLRWERTPSPAEIARAAEEVLALAARGPRALVVIVPEGVSVPERETRDVMIERLADIRSRVRWMGLVLEGGGLVADVKRIFVRAVSALAGQAVPAFSSVAEAAAAAPVELVGDTADFAADFERARKD